jgi:RNA polymerase sigma-70 factor (ECF subfamily)
MCHSDEQCVRRCLDGQRDAFRQLVERHEGPLLGYLIGRLKSYDEAAEAAQETFVRAYFALGKLHKPESFSSWLLGIANRVVEETRRERQRQPATLHERPGPAAVAESVAPPGPEVTQAVTALPEAYRQVILLRYYGAQSCAEISRRLAIPVGTVTGRLSRAYALLRKALQGGDRTQDIEVRQ